MSTGNQTTVKQPEQQPQTKRSLVSRLPWLAGAGLAIAALVALVALVIPGGVFEQQLPADAYITLCKDFSTTDTFNDPWVVLLDGEPTPRKVCEGRAAAEQAAYYGSFWGGVFHALPESGWRGVSKATFQQAAQPPTDTTSNK